MLEDLLDVDACTTAGRAGFLLHAEMWFASHTDYAVLISEPTDGPAWASTAVDSPWACSQLLHAMRGSESRVPWSAEAHSAPCRPPRR
jgi:hypothetical protein